jgi:hypothetical protein
MTKILHLNVEQVYVPKHFFFHVLMTDKDKNGIFIVNFQAITKATKL